jgi:hypothetical protein
MDGRGGIAILVIDESEIWLGTGEGRGLRLE